MVSASTILTMSSMLFDYQEMKNMIACLAHLQHLVLWRPAMIQHQTVQWSRRSLSRRTLQFNIIHTVQEGLDQIYWRNKSMRIQRQTQIQHSYNTCCMMIMTMNHLWNTISGLPETNLQRRWVSHTLESLEPCLGVRLTASATATGVLTLGPRPGAKTSPRRWVRMARCQWTIAQACQVTRE